MYAIKTAKSFLLLLLVLLFLIPSISVYGQKYEIKHINYSDGLSSSNINIIQQDEFGFIWIGTAHGGVYRWDGQELKAVNESLHYSSISDLLLTEDDKFISTFSDVSKLDHKNHIVANLNMKPHFEHEKDRIKKLFRFNNRIVVFTFLGLAFILNPDDLKIEQKLPISKDFYSSTIIQSDNSFLLINGTSYIRLFFNAYNLFSDVWEKPKKLPGLKNARDTENAYKNVIVSEENIFLQRNDSLFSTDQNLNINEKYSFDFTETIYCLLKTKDNWWIGTRSGLYQFQVQDNQLILIKKVLAQTITSLLNADGGILAASMVGFFNIRKQKIQLKEEHQFEGSIYGDFLKIDESIWALRYFEGINIYKKGQIQDSVRLDDVNYGLLRCMFQFDQDSVYIGTTRGLLKLNIEDKKAVLEENFKYSITSIVENHDTLFFGTARNGVFRKIGNKIQNFNSYNDSINIGYTNAVISDKNFTFLSTDEGILQLAGDSLKKIELPIKLEFPPFSLLLNDKNQLFIGTASSGILIYDLAQNKVLRHIRTPELSSNTINFLRCIEGYIWAGTNMGTDIIQSNKDSYTVHKLSDVSSLGAAETALIAIEEVDDKVWIGTIAGTLMIPKDIIMQMKDRMQSKIIIESVTYGNEKTVYQPSNKDSIQALVIPYSQYEINIAFNSMQLDNQSNTYNYRLINYDREVNIVQKPKLAIYKRLPPGNYTFEVWEENPFQEVLNKTSFTIAVQAPFYKTPLFIVGLIVCSVLLLILLVRWYLISKQEKFLRDKNLKENTRNEMRTEMAMDFHDEMGNHLAKIINLSGVLKLQDVPQKYVPTINKIEENAKNLFSSTTNLIWSLKSQNNYLHEIIILIKNFAENLFEQSNIKLQFSNLKTNEPIQLETRRSRDIVLIMKEILTNIYKHASAKNIMITVESEENITIKIEDDGIGFNQEIEFRSGGISNIYQRAKRSNISIKFSSETDTKSGTTVFITLN